MPAPREFPWVRCQIPPEAWKAARYVAERLDWTLPAVYMAAICWSLLEHEPEELIGYITAQLDGSRLDPDYGGDL